MNKPHNLKCIFFLSFCIYWLSSYAENNTLDSLFKQLKEHPADTLGVKTLNHLATLHISQNFVKSMEYAEEARILAANIKYTYGIARSYNIMAENYHANQMQVEAIENYLTAERYYEETGNTERLDRLYNNLGMCYSQINMHKDATKYYEKVAEISRIKNDPANLGRALNNLFIVYKNTKEYKKAEKAYQEALLIFKEEGFIQGEAILNANMATLFILYQQYDSAITYIQKSLEYGILNNDHYNIALNKLNIAEVYNYKKMHTVAESLLHEAFTHLHFVENENNVENIIGNNSIALRSAIYKEQSHTYAFLGKFNEAYNARLNFEILNDSIFNGDLAQKLSDSETKNKNYQSLKKIEILRKEQKIHELQGHKNKILLSSSIAIIILLLLSGGLLFQRFKANRKTNNELTLKNLEISHQKKEITDSINYAKKIQEAILPPESFVKTLLPNSFILYKPKDIVSGDFYWLEEWNNENEKFVLLAAADCTGHGVPGALMSVVGLNLLNQAVFEKKLSKPSLILEHLDWGVNHTLRQSELNSKVKDGMDLGLCSINFDTGKVQYAGAYNPLYYIHKEEFFEIKADKSPIGVNIDGIVDEYSNHEIQLDKGDCVYLLSDGYADQFGGPKGKKFKYKALKELLLTIHKKEMEEQKAILDSTIEQWRNDLEQVDDMLIIGVRI